MTLKTNLPLVITMGEPAGIAWEITSKAWIKRSSLNQSFYFLEDFNRLTKLSTKIPIQKITHPSQATSIFPEALPVFDMPLSSPVIHGSPSTDNASNVVSAIEVAVQHTKSGLASGIITNPIQKSALYNIGFKYPGHTEFLGALSGPNFEPIMMLSCKGLRVVPVTTHTSLLDAITNLTKEKIVKTATSVANALSTDFGITDPHLAIAGVNPHASESGALGHEEQTIIIPAINTLRKNGLCVTGPYAPDTMFSNKTRKTYDAAICMYHDQALIPIKTLDFDGAVNITIGLPFTRTSPDHGTALDIAGQGKASAKSMISAINLASLIIEYRANK